MRWVQPGSLAIRTTRESTILSAVAGRKKDFFRVDLPVSLAQRRTTAAAVVAVAQVLDLSELEAPVAIPALQELARLRIWGPAEAAAEEELPRARQGAQEVKVEWEVCRSNIFGHNGHEVF